MLEVFVVNNEIVAHEKVDVESRIGEPFKITKSPSVLTAISDEALVKSGFFAMSLTELENYMNIFMPH